MLVCDVVDVTTYHRGFHGDLNETFFVGAVSEKVKLLVQTTHECLAKAIAAGSKHLFVTACCFLARCLFDDITSELSLHHNSVHFTLLIDVLSSSRDYTHPNAPLLSCCPYV